MSDERARTAPILFFAPFVSSTMRVEPSWIDYNGHMNMAYYHVLFDRAIDEAFELVGLGQDYVQERGASYFAAETHTVYKRELKLHDSVRVTMQLLDFDEKRIHYFMEARHAGEGWVAACTEHLALHVDMDSRKVAPFPDDVLDNLAILRAAHARLARPSDLSRVIAMARSREERRSGPAYASGTTRH